MNCVFSTTVLTDHTWEHKCQGKTIVAPSARCIAECDCGLHGPPKLGLGDLSAYALAHLGITKEKFSAWIGKECNCPERQEKLNRFRRYLAKRAEKLGITLLF